MQAGPRPVTHLVIETLIWIGLHKVAGGSFQGEYTSRHLAMDRSGSDKLDILQQKSIGCRQWFLHHPLSRSSRSIGKNGL